MARPTPGTSKSPAGREAGPTDAVGPAKVPPAPSTSAPWRTPPGPVPGTALMSTPSWPARLRAQGVAAPVAGRGAGVAVGAAAAAPATTGAEGAPGEAAQADQPVIEDDGPGDADVDRERRRNADREVAARHHGVGKRAPFRPQDIGGAAGMAKAGQLDRVFDQLDTDQAAAVRQDH